LNTEDVGADGPRRGVRKSGLGLQAVDKASGETSAFLETLLAGVPVGQLFVDREFRYLRVNEKVAAIHGSPSVDYHIGNKVSEVVT
jgi:nitrogen fixation/metabolism regulation signal transduction histidine kinase